MTFAAGAGGDVPLATTNATGGTGGTLAFSGGPGGLDSSGGSATNAATGGNGGLVTVFGGAGGSPNIAATNTVGGNGGSFGMAGGSGGTPGSGWARKGGNGAAAFLQGGAGGSGTRTNGGDGGAARLLGGAAGSGSTGGNAGTAGNVEITGGAGANGNTNSNGGSVFAAGGAQGTSATPGDVVLARQSDGVSRGGVMIGPLLGGSAAVTNVLGGAASLDFGSVATLTSEDLPIAVTGVVSNNCAVALSVPWESSSGGGVFSTFCSNDTVYVRFSNNTALSIDPTPGTFSVVVFRIR